MKLAGAVLLFDLDGTLIESQPGIVRCFSETLKHFGVDAPLATITEMVGVPLWEMFQAFAMSGETVEEAVAHYRKLYGAGGFKEAEVYAGAAEALLRLRDAGARLAVATSKSQQYAGIVVEHFGLGQFFEVIVGANDDGTRRHKPELIAEALRQMGAVGVDSLMFGDRDLDVLGAQAAGIQSVAVLWGYGSKEELAAANPIALVSRWSDVPALVEEL